MQTKTRLTAVVLHRISCLLEEGDTIEAHERLDHLEALCLDTLDMVQDMRQQDFKRAVEEDISALPLAN